MGTFCVGADLKFQYISAYYYNTSRKYCCIYIYLWTILLFMFGLDYFRISNSIRSLLLDFLRPFGLVVKLGIQILVQ
jgi:hypothetical protein